MTCALTAHFARSARSDLPPPLSGPLSGPLAWSGADLAPDAYTAALTAQDNGEIEAAVEAYKALGLGWDRLSPQTFPLPGLAPRLAEAAEAVHGAERGWRGRGGHGFVVITGLDASRYSVDDAVFAYLGLASHVADQRGVQDRRGNVLCHITDSKAWDVPAEQRHGIHSSKPLPFHTDMGCDVLALQVREGAHRGGRTYLSSAAAVLNCLLRDEPAVARTLLAPDWPVQISGRRRRRHYLAPAFAVHRGRLMASMDPNRFGPHAASPDGVPPLTAAQRHALGRVEAVARRLELGLRLETGSLLFLNNWALLHRRDAYRDDERTARHLVRLWLRNTQLGWPVPAPMLPPWLAAYGDRAAPPQYALHPPATYIVPKYSAGSAAFVLEDDDYDGSDE